MIENGVKIVFLEFQNSLVRMTFQAILIRYWVEHTRWVLVVAQDKFNRILRRQKGGPRHSNDSFFAMTGYALRFFAREVPTGKGAD